MLMYCLPVRVKLVEIAYEICLLILFAKRIIKTYIRCAAERSWKRIYVAVTEKYRHENFGFTESFQKISDQQKEDILSRVTGLYTDNTIESYKTDV